MLRYICIVGFLYLTLGVGLAQIQISESMDHELGPGLAIPNNSANYTGSMNNHISAQENILSYKNYQYISFYNDERKVVVGRRDLCGDTWELLVLEDYVQTLDDRHNFISMGICEGDGTIHLAFDHHAHNLRYRISVLGLAVNPEEFVWDASLFGPIQNNLVEGVAEIRVTYPVFFSTQDGHLNLAWRKGGSGNGESRIGFYNAKSHTWENVHTFVEAGGVYQDPYLAESSNSRNPYHFDFVYDENNVLHASWVWREGSQSGYNHDIAYAWSPNYGFTWYNNDSIQIADYSEANPTYISYNSPGLHVWTLDSRYGMINGGGQTLDHLNQPHLIARHRIEPAELPSPKYANSSDGSFFHYWRDTTGTWHQQEIPHYGSRTNLYSDTYGNLYMPYGTNRLRLVVAEAADNWANWTQIYQATRITQRNEHHADRNRLMQDGVLTIVSHEFDGASADGPMFLSEFKLSRDHNIHIQLDPEADTYVRADSFSDQNFGARGTLVVKDNINNVFDRQIFLRFDLNQLADLSVSNIQKAELVMDVQTRQNGYAGELYDLFKIEDDNWNEDSLTLNNAPTPGTLIQTLEGDSLQMRWDLTLEVINEWATDGRLSLSLRNSEEGGNSIIHFFSKEASANGLGPRLEIIADSACSQTLKPTTRTVATDIEKKDFPSLLTLSPNPTEGILHVNVQLDPSRMASWEITDLQGRLLRKSSADFSQSSGIQRIDIQALPTGIYFFQLHVDEGATLTQKIIKR